MPQLPSYLVPIGQGRVYRDTRSGRIITDADSIVRTPRFAGEEEQPTQEDAVYEGELFDHFGARAPNAVTPYRAPAGYADSSIPPNTETAVISENKEVDAEGDCVIRLRAQHPFLANDVTFSGSPEGMLVKFIEFGDKDVFKTPAGVPAEMFVPSSQMRNLLRNKTIKAGLDITVTVWMPGPGRAFVTFTGYKPKGA